MAPMAPRPSPRPIAAWSSPKQQQSTGEGKEKRPAWKQVQSTTPPAKPKRERPCDGCRRRKSKCVLQENRKCLLCEFHKQECTFVENAQPRKRKAPDDASKDDSSSPMEKRSPVARRKAVAVPPAVRAVSVPHPEPISRPVSSQPPMRKPFAVDESLSLQRHRHCKYLGQTTPLDASLIALGTFNDKNETQSRLGTLRQVTSTEYFSTHDDASVAIPDDEARALKEIEQVVGSHGPALIDIYFRNVHPSYPIIQKQAFLDRHRHGDRHFNPPLLAAMYLMALVWWEHDPALASHPKPDVTRLEYIAMASLTIAMQRPKISAVQAGLLLLQRAKASTWTLTVQLVALGQDIGLHLDCSDWSIPRWERLLRKRLAWALYMQDKWSAVIYGRPSHVNASDWNVPQATEDDFDESIDSSNPSSEEVDSYSTKGRVVFMQMISLTAIMAEVCETFYSETAKAQFAQAGRFAPQLVLNRAKPVQLKLKDWIAKLPASCKMDSFTPGTLSPQGHLHLAYFATEISIHRRIVQSLDGGTTPPTTSTTQQPQHQSSSIDPYLLYICRSAAKTRLISALDFVNRLKPEHLNAFWYFPSSSNFALIGTFGALLQTTSPGKEESHFYACRLNEFHWTLTVSRRKAGWIERALEMLGATGELLRGLPEKPSLGFGSEGGMMQPQMGLQGQGQFGRLESREEFDEREEEEEEAMYEEEEDMDME
ncbi:hypothetical protein CBER1_09274 [Cercospora berteroae]|uniref:Zn(2)-C6 fungal-type domain-containing protein n=1 Tax=Cercospora berteroae TaxID=357750 RepID=A0A2S6CGK4_9PEZI|nr:hypothetical protein CBER1_09274 [Cercospora berteroae]